MYRVQLDQFEGPLDLLLFFIRRDEVDIFDIPVGRIADEYLAYVRLIDELDLDGAADFIFMAALLIQIKARMLMPRQEIDDDGEEIDPRAELVERLLEYLRYKEAAEHLAGLQDERARKFTRGNASAVDLREGDPDGPIAATVFDLVSVLQRVLARVPEEVVTHDVERYDFTVKDQKAMVVAALKGGKLTFSRLLLDHSEGPLRRGYIIATFLAILDLMQGQFVLAKVGAEPDDFTLAAGPRHSEFEESREAAHDEATW